ncbi:LysR substrate-binding domain-containing protein [Chelativorans xinjiangense]|uniref:LysR substrate-binding domain-containing protein n=1 Tax=Chelativorans xinjiangense TaxID=2681485 RepID=UPI001356A6EA|nr:LysR substrate-binding domain-containing protein [Chelativorans xinjiangense]
MNDRLEIPNIRHLRMVQMIGQLGGVTCASRTLNTSQPAVTQAISNLETELGAELFERRATGTYPTKVGRLFLRRIDRFFDILEHTMAIIRGASERPAPPVERLITATQVRALIVTSEPSTVNEVASRLGVSASTLYRSVRELERHIGHRLFISTANGQVCNKTGEYLARRMRRAVREIEFARSEVRSATGTGNVKIMVGALPMAGSSELATATCALLARRPKARVQILTRDYHSLLDDLENCRIDMIFGLLRRPEWATDVEEEIFFRDSYCIAARHGHPLTCAPEITPEVLTQYDWIVPAAGTPRRKQIDGLFEDFGQKPHFGIETSSLATLRALLSKSDMITVMARSEMTLDVNVGMLASLPCRYLSPMPPKGLTTRSGWLPTEAHLDFIDCLRTATSPAMRERGQRRPAELAIAS